MGIERSLGNGELGFYKLGEQGFGVLKVGERGIGGDLGTGYSDFQSLVTGDFLITGRKLDRSSCRLLSSFIVDFCKKKPYLYRSKALAEPYKSISYMLRLVNCRLRN